MKYDKSAPYSFCVFDDEEIFSLDESPQNEENDINIYDDTQTKLAILSHQNDKIIQEYSLSDEYTNLYRKIDDNKFALLYQSEIYKNENLHISIFNENNCFFAEYESNELKNLLSMNPDDFIFNQNMHNSIPNIPIIKHVGNIITNLISNRYLNPIIIGGKFIDTNQNQSLLRYFKETQKRYFMATNIIPAQCILKEIIKDINQYIASGKFDEENILTNYIYLQNFQGICSGTISDLSLFVNDPSSIDDFRYLCDSLNTKVSNMENLINMYLSDELRENNRS